MYGLETLGSPCYIHVMPKLEKIYDARLEIRLESALKASTEAAAKAEKVSTNEFVRRALSDRIAKQRTLATSPLSVASLFAGNHQIDGKP